MHTLPRPARWARRGLWLGAWMALLVARGLAQPAPSLPDDWLLEVFRSGEREAYPAAAAAYLVWLDGLGGTVPPAEAEGLRPYLEALALVVPPALRDATGFGHLPPDGALAFPDDAGSRLVRWWRSQDPAPATDQNEALLIHLERVAYARAHYRHGGAFDDRGRVYIRLGPPARTTSADFQTTAFREKVLRPNLTLTAAEFPENVLWVYGHIDRAAQFLFVKRGGRFVGAEVADLLPPALQNSVSASERGRQRGEALIRTLEEVYRNLSLHHPLYSDRYADVATYVDRLDVARKAAFGEQVRSQVKLSPAGSREGGGGPPSVEEQMAARAQRDAAAKLRLPVPPNEFARQSLSRATVEDRQAARERAAHVPRTYVDVAGKAAPFPLFVRTARFLDADGTTRTEIYWAPPPERLPLSKALRERLAAEGFAAPFDLLVVGTLRQWSRAYTVRGRHVRQQVLTGVTGDGPQMILPQTYTARGDTGQYHLGVQWDVYGVALDAGRVRPVRAGTRLRMNVFRADSLHALDPDARRLEMSDLKPLLVPEGGLPPAGIVAWAAEAPAYPFPRIPRERPPALYFEVYHLAFGADDQTHFTIEYEVSGREKDERVRKKEEAPPGVAARTTATSPSRTAAEVVLLDLSRWGGQGDVWVHVRVTDTTTGQSVRRSIRFVVDP